MKRRVLIGMAIGVTVIAVIALLAVLHPWNINGNNKTSITSIANADEETNPTSDVDTIKDGLADPKNIIIADTKIDYSPGEFGEVITDKMTGDDFSNSETFFDYEANWHDKSWHGEIPQSGRYKYAHFKQDENFKWVAGEVIVAFPYETEDAWIEDIAATQSAHIGAFQSSEILQDYKMALFYYDDDAIDPLITATDLQASYAEIIAAFPNVVSYSDSGISVSDTEAYNQDYLEQSRFYEAWSEVECNNSVCVAVLDSGINFTHEDLINNINTEYAYDAIENTGLTSATEDVNGHGTKVAGIIAAQANNGLGIAGCSYNATILPIRVSNSDGSQTVWDVSEAFDYLIAHPLRFDIVNMSFGTGSNVIFGQIYKFTLQGKVDYLTNEYDIVFVAASGNEGDEGNYIEYPAALNNVISVAAVDEKRIHASFSTANETIDICARGTNIYTTLAGGTYGNGGNGTSFAAPQVASVAALLKAQNPTWSAERIANKLESTAIRLEDMADVDENGKDTTGKYGYGLLDAAAAVGYASSSGGNSGSTSPNTGGSVANLYRHHLEKLNKVA